MKVRCIDDRLLNITKGLTYNVESIGEVSYVIADDDGIIQAYSKEYFEIVEDIEDIEEKRKQVYEYCADTSCGERCKLHKQEWEHYFDDNKVCLNVMKADEKELDKALELINSENHLEKSINKVADTVLEGDMVHHPSHYNYKSMECKDVIDVMTEYIGSSQAYKLGCVIKYLYRYPLKNGVEDLQKAKTYIDMIIKELEEKENE